MNCKCGCGAEVGPDKRGRERRYVNGHNGRPRPKRCIRGHEQIPENVYVSKRGRRECRLCRRDRRRAKAERDRELRAAGVSEEVPVTWENARAAKGPEVARWLRAVVPPELLQEDTLKRRLYDWDRGSSVDFYALDRRLVRWNLHPVMLPNDVWLAKRPPPYSRPDDKACEGCGQVIPWEEPNGKPKGGKAYSQARFHSIECMNAHKGQVA